jgi:hypothetical protein
MIQPAANRRPAVATFAAAGLLRAGLRTQRVNSASHSAGVGYHAALDGSLNQSALANG